MNEKPTVVLVHGLAILQPAHRMFLGVSEHLESRGFRSTRTLVQGDGSLEALTERLVAQLRKIDGPLALLCHSMGGLEARHAILDDSIAARVRAIATVGTPHAGAPLALAGGLVNRAYRDLTPGARAEWQERFGNAEAQAIHRHRIRCLSAVARLHRRARHLPLVFSQLAVRLTEGASDGLVSVDSQAWGDVVGEVELDHRQCVLLGVGEEERRRAVDLWTMLAEASCRNEERAA